MHGIDPGEDTYTTTKEDGWMSQKVKERLLSPQCPQPGSCELVRCIGNTCLYGQPAPEEFYSFHVTAELFYIMLTLQ
jgi:hypothetical protein